MKVFQIVDGFCFYDATRLYPNAGEAARHYSPDTLWVDAPDYVFDGWGYDETAEGDARFIQPTPPDGWEYDDATGTFYPSGETPPSKQPTEQDDVNAMLIDQELRLLDLELGFEEGGEN